MIDFVAGISCKTKLHEKFPEYPEISFFLIIGKNAIVQQY